MYKHCPTCGFYSSDPETGDCPTCSTPLRLTMLPPSGEAAENVEIPEIDPALLAPRCESMELPAPVRFGQVVGGCFFFMFVTRWGVRVLSVMIGGNAVETGAQAAYVLACTGLIYVLASLIGGGVAGACSVNWVPQGIGVGIGVFALPILLMFFLIPESLPLFFLGILLTTPLTVLGAYLGHKVVRPSQFFS
ncbi:MAG: hypothetical protein KDA92_04025 [Planctomycetales bacterium]|nr:hypothetical protein [Planctomycetales bacterium]MCA9167604.1 hypothetical protein [Planctomycetales bacterium]